MEFSSHILLKWANTQDFKKYFKQFAGKDFLKDSLTFDLLLDNITANNVSNVQVMLNAGMSAKSSPDFYSPLITAKGTSFATFFARPAL